MYQLGLRHNFGVAKEFILDGYASLAGIIDTDSVMEDLHAAALGHTEEMWPLQHLLAVEAWCRGWP